MNTITIPDEPAECSLERALDSAALLPNLAHELRRRLHEGQIAGRMDDALAHAAAVHVARAVSLVN